MNIFFGMFSGKAQYNGKKEYLNGMKEKIKALFQFDKKKAVAGCVLGAAVLVLGILFYDWFIGVLFALMFALPAFLRINVQSTKIRYALHILWSFFVAFAVWKVSVSATNAAAGMVTSPRQEFLNFVCIYAFFLLVFVFTANCKASVITASAILVFLAAVNGIIYQFRGKELGPMDILSLRTALNVAGQYEALIATKVVYGIWWWALAVFAGFIVKNPKPVSKIRPRVIALLLFVLSVVHLGRDTGDIPIKTWDNEGTRLNGYYLNFYLGLKEASARKPKDYSEKQVRALENVYAQQEEAVPAKKPNVLIIMDESFADFRVLGNAPRTDTEIMPFMDSLQENTVRGFALSSVYGGNTANSEYEVLTGHTMGFLPENSVPYQQYMDRETYSLAHYMRSLGYRTMATHPYYENGWSRNTVYPLLGFETCTFLDSYPQEDKLRGYVTDREMFAYIVKQLKEDNGDKPLFLCGITMQNHGGYGDGGNFRETVKLTGYKENYPMAEDYLSLIHTTDHAVKYLITELKKLEEDTVVLFFGDHFPKIEDELYETLLGSDFDRLSEQMLRYKMPFYIWANYDIPEETVACTSLNYLPRYLLDAAGIPLPPYYRFLADMEKVVPNMNALGYYSSEREKYLPLDQAAGTEAEWLKKYENLQYNGVFDHKNKSELFFKIPKAEE